MKLYAAVARRRLGQLIGGDDGDELTRAAEAWMSAQDIADPAHVTAMLAPSFIRASTMRKKATF